MMNDLLMLRKNNWRVLFGNAQHIDENAVLLSTEFQ